MQDLLFDNNSIFHPGNSLLDLLPLIFLNLPSLWRLRQCIAEYNSFAKFKNRHFYNGIKYSIAIIAITAGFILNRLRNSNLPDEIAMVFWLIDFI